MIFSSRSICSFVLSLVCLLGVAGRASAGPCAIELQKRSAVTIDGSNSSGEWGTDGRISSADGCLDQVHELKSGGTYDVTVYSRRYDQGGTEYLGFLFVVPDATTQDANNPSQSTTEQMYVYFDPDRSGGSALATGSSGSAGTDYRMKLEHDWTSQPAGGLQSSLEWATATSSVTCSPNEFQAATLPSNASAAVAQRSPGPGYLAEVRIPVSAIGNSGTDVGIAFAVVDDQGTYQATSAVTDKYAASFPASLPSTNPNNPANTCPADYHMPDNYGVGLWTSTAGDVTISRQPVFWNSEDIRALQCGEMSTYTYSPNAPCELTLEATVHNARPADLVRHVLYVWADHGASPSNWRFVDLQQTTVGAGSDRTVTSDIWDQVPFGLAHHPCVRAYILPENLNQGGWSETRVRNVSSNADLSDMMSAYGLSTANWAQKNISAGSSTDECPNEQCQVEGQGSPGGVLLLEGNGGAGPVLVGLLLVILVGLVSASVRRVPWPRTRRVLGLVLILVFVVACRQMKPPGLLVSDAEYNQFHDTHAIVQMQVYGVVPAQNPGPRSASFFDVMGGVHRLLPEEQVAEEARNGIPMEVQVTNTGENPRRLLLKVTSVLPSGLQEKELELTFEQERERQVIEPGETRTLRGRLVQESSPPVIE